MIDIPLLRCMAVVNEPHTNPIAWMKEGILKRGYYLWWFNIMFSPMGQETASSLFNQFVLPEAQLHLTSHKWSSKVMFPSAESFIFIGSPKNFTNRRPLRYGSITEEGLSVFGESDSGHMSILIAIFLVSNSVYYHIRRRRHVRKFHFLYFGCYSDGCFASSALLALRLFANKRACHFHFQALLLHAINDAQVVNVTNTID